MNAPQMPQTLTERHYLFLGQPLSPKHHSLEPSLKSLDTKRDVRSYLCRVRESTAPAIEDGAACWLLYPRRSFRLRSAFFSPRTGLPPLRVAEYPRPPVCPTKTCTLSPFRFAALRRVKFSVLPVPPVRLPARLLPSPKRPLPHSSQSRLRWCHGVVGFGRTLQAPRIDQDAKS